MQKHKKYEKNQSNMVLPKLNNPTVTNTSEGEVDEI
jgi:hypothetical protein